MCEASRQHSPDTWPRAQRALLPRTRGRLGVAAISACFGVAAIHVGSAHGRVPPPVMRSMAPPRIPPPFPGSPAAKSQETPPARRVPPPFPGSPATSGASAPPTEPPQPRSSRQESRPRPDSACAPSIACTDEERAETLIYDAHTACARSRWDDCATLAERARTQSPKAATAATAGLLIAIASRRGGRAATIRTSPGFLSGLLLLSGGVRALGLLGRGPQILAEIDVGRRFGELGGKRVFQLDGGVTLGSFSPYGTPPAGLNSGFGVVDGGEVPAKFVSPRLGGGVGMRFTIGFAIRTAKYSAIEFVCVPGMRVIGGSATGELTFYADLGAGVALQIGRLRFETLGQVSTGTVVRGDGFSPPLFGLTARGSIGLGRGRK